MCHPAWALALIARQQEQAAGSRTPAEPAPVRGLDVPPEAARETRAGREKVRAEPPA